MGPSPMIRESYVTLASGHRLHYAEAGIENPCTLVLLHGFTDSWRSFELVMPLLAPWFRVLAPDFRGHGNSAKPDGPDGDYSTGQLARDVIEFLDTRSLKTATLVGHSMGSFVARRAAVEAPSRVKSLVLVGTALTGDNENVRALRREVERFQGSIPEAFVRDFQSGCVANANMVPDYFFNSCVAASLRVPPYVWRAALGGLMDSDQTYRLGTITCPTLVIGGRRDLVFSQSEQEEVVRSIPGARGCFYRHSGHSPHWEEPGRFADDLQDFVDAIP